MKLLFLSSSMGPAEVLWYERFRRQGHDVDVLSLSHLAWLTGDARRTYSRPANWIASVTLQKFGNQISSYFRRVIEQGAHEVVFASGLSANGIAIRHVSLPFIPILWREDLDFSRSRAMYTRRFADLTNQANVLFLEDDYEFDKALSKGSKSVHLLHPKVSFYGLPKLLSESDHDRRVALIYPEGSDRDRVLAYQAMLEPVASRHGADIIALPADGLFRARDLTRSRTFHERARDRLQGASHLVMLGSSRHASSIGQYLLDTVQESRLTVEDTIGLSNWCQQVGFSRYGRGSRLTRLLDESLSLGSSCIATRPDVVKSADTVNELVTRVETDYPSMYEELDATAADGTFNVFFSTTGLEDRTDGARPQRIRNMAQALSKDAPTIRIASNMNGFHRRRELVHTLLVSGRQAGIFYGENSTSPIPSPAIREELGDFLRNWRKAGGRSAWFVRDLHWLDPQTGIAGPSQDGEVAEIITHGLHELNVVGGSVDLLLAPDTASSEGYKRLLSGHQAPNTPWGALPPGVASENIFEMNILPTQRSGPTLLYAGGVGAVYSMSNLLAALRKLVDQDFYIDFVVRPGETGQLQEEIESFGLSDHPNVSISTNSLDVYLPKSDLTIGAILLDSEYARFSFPYKTVSMIEKGFPIITYSDMAIAEFVERTGVGVVTERDSDSLINALESMSRLRFVDAIEIARKGESWGARIEQIKAMLEKVVVSG